MRQLVGDCCLEIPLLSHAWSIDTYIYSAIVDRVERTRTFCALLALDALNIHRFLIAKLRFFSTISNYIGPLYPPQQIVGIRRRSSRIGVQQQVDKFVASVQGCHFSNHGHT